MAGRRVLVNIWFLETTLSEVDRPEKCCEAEECCEARYVCIQSYSSHPLRRARAVPVEPDTELLYASWQSCDVRASCQAQPGLKSRTTAHKVTRRGTCPVT